MADFHRLVGQMIIEKTDFLARIAVDQQYGLQFSLWEPYNALGYNKSLRDMGYHFSCLAEALAVDKPSLFLDYVGWAKVLFFGLNLPSETLTVSLECMGRALQETLPPEMAALTHTYIDASLRHLHQANDSLQSFLCPDAPLFDLATIYLNALLQGDRHFASQLILESVANGISVKNIYLNVFQPCQQEVGRKWQMNQISVAQEHFCTAATQMIMSQLYPYIFSTTKIGRRLIATSVGGELHEIGMRMVADFFEMGGWTTYYLGANTPVESIVKALENQPVDVLAISATLSLHIGKVVELIDKTHGSPHLSAVKILVGGYPFNVAKDLWKEVGADGYAPNAQEAVLMANRLVEDT